MLNSVLEYFVLSYQKYPDKTAIVDGGSKTYRELYVDVCKVAGWINSKIEERKRPIIVLMKNSIDAIVAFGGVALSGNIYVPVDFEMPSERLEAIIEILNPLYIIDAVGTSEVNVMKDIQVISLCEMLESEYDSNVIEQKNRIIDTDPLYILFTSGSTGVPKGVVISHKAAIDFVEEASETMMFSDKEIFLNQVPFYFDMSVLDIYCTIKNGATLHIVNRNMFVYPIKLMDYIEKNQINAIYWVPSALVMAANLHVLGKRDISCLKKIMFAGEVMPTKQFNMWRRAVPQAVFVNYYGPSETTCASTYYIVDREFEDSEPLPIGKAAKNTTVFILSENGRECKVNEIGEMYIGGSGVSAGYYNNRAKTDENFVQNPAHHLYNEILYKTGDLAHYGEDGNIYYDGRADYQIKHMGYRIELGEIEHNISAMDGVDRTACIYREDKDIIIGYYSGGIEEKAVMEFLKKKLPFYMVPKQLRRLESLPMNPNGKVDRKRLKELLWENEK